MYFSHFLGAGATMLDKTNVFLTLSAEIIRKAAMDNLTSMTRYNKRGITDSLEKFKEEKHKLIWGWEEVLLKKSETQVET